MDNILSIKNVIIVSFLMLIFLTIKNDGIIDYYRLSNQHIKLLLKEQDFENQLYELKQENRLLKYSNQYIEKIARENFFYLFPNETIIHF